MPDKKPWEIAAEETTEKKPWEAASEQESVKKKEPTQSSLVSQSQVSNGETGGEKPLTPSKELGLETPSTSKKSSEEDVNKKIVNQYNADIAASKLPYITPEAKLNLDKKINSKEYQYTVGMAKAKLGNYNDAVKHFQHSAIVTGKQIGRAHV